MTVGNRRSTGKLHATTLFFTGIRPKSTVELGVAAAAYVLHMCKMATVQIFLEHSNRDVHVGIGFVRNRNMSAGPINDRPYPLCWRHQAQWRLHVTSNSSFSLLHIQPPQLFHFLQLLMWQWFPRVGIID